MRVFLSGVGCVGKTTVGLRLAELMGLRFFDLDTEIERLFEMSIEQLHQKYWMPHDFRRSLQGALVNLGQTRKSAGRHRLAAERTDGRLSVVIKKTQGLKVTLLDKPERILDRIVFYDVDSSPMDKRLTNEERPLYLKEIKKNITYFKKSYTRADLQVSIEDMDVEQAAHHILAQLKVYSP